jgi:type IV pilus secretin (or competence protein) PilQ
MNGFIRKTLIVAMIASQMSCTSHPVDDDLSLDMGGQDAVSAAADDALNEGLDGGDLDADSSADTSSKASNDSGGDDFAEFDGESAQHEQANNGQLGGGDQDMSIEDELNDASGEAPPQQAATPPPAEAPAEDPFADNNVAAAPPQEAPIPEPQIEEMNPPAPEVAAQPEPEPQPEPAAPVESRGQPSKITNLKFKANDTGGTVIVESDKPVSYTTRFNSDLNQFVVEVDNAILPDKLKRSLNTKDIAGSFGAIDAYQNPGASTARFVIQLRPGVAEPAVQVEGNSLLIMGSSNEALASNGTNGGGREVEHTGGDDESPGVETAGDGKMLASQNLAEFLAGNTRFYGKKVSIETNNMDIRDALNFITEESGVNMVIAEEVKGNISLKLRQVPWDQALVMIMKAKKLGYTRQGNVLRIAPIADLKAEEDDATKLALAKKDVEPLKVRMFPVSYGKVDDLEKKIKDFLGARGKVVGDVRTNSLVVTDIQDNLERVARLIASLDVQPSQVLIEGKIVEAKESFNRRVGVDWRMSGGSIPLGNTARGPVNMRPTLSVNPTGATQGQFNLGINVGTFDIFGDLSATLALAETEEQVKVISSPRIMAMSNEKANINQTTEVPVKQVTINGNSTQTTYQFKPLQLKLEVTPQVTSDGSVIMTLAVSRQFRGATVSAIDDAFSVNSREAQTKVLVKNGHTAVIGGIYQSDATDSEIGVPWFRELPFLGYLFKTKATTKEKSELLIFLTPRILGQVDSTNASQTSDF